MGAAMGVRENTSVTDVRAHGVEGDGETDDTAALQSALDEAAPHGTVYIPADLRVRIGDTVTVEFSEDGEPSDPLSRFKFICDGVLTPDPGIGTAIELTDAVAPYVFVNAQGGGKDVESDSLFYVTGGRDGLFEGFGHRYDGRMFHFENTGTYSIRHLKTLECGQAVAVFDASPMGEIRDVFEISPTQAPEFHNSTDICINQYENYQGEDTTTRGVLLEDCLSVFVDRLLVGGDAETPPVEFRDCDNMFVNALHLGGFPGLGGLFENVRNSTFRIVCNVGERGIRYTGERSNGNRFVINATNTRDRGVIIDESISGGYHYFTGNVFSQEALAFDIRTATAEIHLDNVYATENRNGDLRLAEDNEVHLRDCHVGDIDGTPRTINGVGVHPATESLPDPSEWPAGTHVVSASAEDDGTELYLVLEDRWVRYGNVEISSQPTTGNGDR